MSRRARFVVASCWLAVVFLLLRMAWGGSLFGIVYVLEVTHPLVLAAGALTIAIALAATGRVLFASDPGVRPSLAVAALAVPLSVVLILQSHASAPVVAGAAILAVLVSLRSTPERRANE